MKLLESLLNLLFPPKETCPLCGDKSAENKICADCGLWLTKCRQQPFCYRCGRPSVGQVCEDCINKERPFLLARAVAPYQGPMRQAVHRFKYQGKQQLAAPLGKLMLQRIAAEPLYHHCDLVVPIPMAKTKERLRGYNQALLLAQVVAAGLTLPCRQVLIKVRDTVPQANLNRRQRELNLQEVLQLKNNGNIKGRRVLLIDDVITTCATVSTAAAVLRQGGATEVLVLTLAATPNIAK
ncbi:ComF family protein [Peptococcaceae bacterium 1198_IL3148]